MTNTVIEPLFCHAGLTEAVAQPIHAEFWQESGGMTVADLANHLDKTHDPARLPLCLIALCQGTLVGTINLIDNDDKKRTHLHPWLAALVVVPELRGSGTRLVQAPLAENTQARLSGSLFRHRWPGFNARLVAQVHEQVSDGFCIVCFALDGSETMAGRNRFAMVSSSCDRWRSGRSAQCTIDTMDGTRRTPPATRAGCLSATHRRKSMPSRNSRSEY